MHKKSLDFVKSNQWARDLPTVDVAMPSGRVDFQLKIFLAVLHPVFWCLLWRYHVEPAAQKEAPATLPLAVPLWPFCSQCACGNVPTLLLCDDVA